MAQSVALWGAVYSDVPEVRVPSPGGGMTSFYDIADTTATASDVASGKYFYTSAGVRTAGTHVDQSVSVTTTQDTYGGDVVTITGIAAQTPKPIIIRPDAVLEQTYTYDKYIHADEEVDIPAYSTSAKTLKAASSITHSANFDDYDYYVSIRTLTIPSYNTSSVGAGRCEYSFLTAIYECGVLPTNTLPALADPSKKFASTVTVGGNYTQFQRVVSWSSASDIVAADNTSGTYQTVGSTTVSTSGSSPYINIRTPALIIRGNTTYLTQTYFEAITDIRYQWVIDVYRIQKGTTPFDGWNRYSQVCNVISCINSSNHKLV